jgi:hypothetical protein
MTDIYPKDPENLMLRLMHACENAASELESLRMLREHELGVSVGYENDTPYIQERPLRTE